MKFIELFSGIGGFRSGFAGHECVFSSEIDKFARTSYNAIYGDVPRGDIRNIDASSIPDHDILTGGFPCQAFSISGRRDGFNDDRGNLIYEITRILEVKQPKYLLLENVRGLLSHDKGRTFQTILDELAKLGYAIEYKLLNSKNFGIPQNRDRVYIFGTLANYKFHSIFNNTNACYKDVKLLDVLEDCDNVETKFYYDKEKSDSLIDYNNSSKGIHQSYRVTNVNKVCPTLTTMQGGGSQPKIIAKNGLVRRLTPLECWRLQGFTDEQFNLAKSARVSNMQLYKQAGNAVTVNVIKHLASEINRVMG